MASQDTSLNDTQSPPSYTDPIPEHLTPYITEQDYSLYTDIDHEAWRFIMRLNKDFFKDNAHKKYLDGLKETGISTERIPHIEEMDDCLKRFGWRAIGVSGFIPPGAFMEFQSLGVLPIACDMRKVVNLAYTPAPDIVHEAAGHAPIIADLSYANYLKAYGEVARKAIFTKQDMDVYNCIRDLSETKEDPKSTEEDIAASQSRLDQAVAAVDYVSEATYLSRMNWWTVEYGLVGDITKPKIYGAGLLSSTGESFSCLKEDVVKVPMTLDCVNMTYDITRPQPQLYVTPNFEHLTTVLGEMADTMAFKKGGVEGIAKAKIARTVTTTQLDSGIQVSGILDNYLTDAQLEPCYLQFKGPSQLSFGENELEGHSASYHKEGFGTAVGRLKGTAKSPAEISLEELEDLGFKFGHKGTLEFESGVKVEGVFKDRISEGNVNLLLSFTDCKVTYKDEVLFDPSWGTYDMACGAWVTSVFGGAADRVKYMKAVGGFGQAPGKMKTNYQEKYKDIIAMYTQVRDCRDSLEKGNKVEGAVLADLAAALDAKYPKDWLLRMSLLELDEKYSLESNWAENTRRNLGDIADKDPVIANLVRRGFAALEHEIETLH